MGPNSAWDLQFTALGFRLRFRLQDLGLNALGLYVLRDLGFVVLLSLFLGKGSGSRGASSRYTIELTVGTNDRSMAPSQYSQSACIYACMYVHMHVCSPVCLSCLPACLSVRACVTCVHASMYVCMYVRVYAMYLVIHVGR